MMEPLMLKAVLQDKMWGGTRLHDQFDFELPSDHTGEAWVASAHNHGLTVVKNGRFKGQNLAQLWQSEPALFENKDTSRPFPLLVKILDAQQNLSVQVHPDDAYAKEHVHELGKTEAWYVLHAEPGAKIYFGHAAKTREEFAEMVDAGRWDELLKTMEVKAGDVFYVPAGTLHALGAGVMVLEVQESSDTTYRVYDFDRRDAKTGKLRELHREDAKAVVTVPAVEPKTNIKTETHPSYDISWLVEEPAFNIVKWDIHGTVAMQKENPYTIVTTIDGVANLMVGTQTYPLRPGTTFILPSDVTSWTLEGEATLIAATPGPASL